MWQKGGIEILLGNARRGEERVQIVVDADAAERGRGKSSRKVRKIDHTATSGDRFCPNAGALNGIHWGEEVNGCPCSDRSSDGQREGGVATRIRERKTGWRGRRGGTPVQERRERKLRAQEDKK